MFKIYTNPNDFIKENNSILNENLLDTSFFINNSKYLKGISRDSYMFKFYRDNNFLLVNYLKPYCLSLYGNNELLEEAVNTLCDYNLEFDKVLATRELCEEFLSKYKSRMGGAYTCHISMDIMYASKCIDIDYSMVERCNDNDVEEVLNLHNKFVIEATGDSPRPDSLNRISNSITDYYCVKIDDKIVSIAKRTRDEDKMCSISSVFTLAEYRLRGYSKKIVARITSDILADGKIPYLYVDKANPISNGLYSSIGYVYGNPRYEYRYQKTNIKSILLAGGCFWCASKPYYEYDGVKRVLSGYAGGSEINPTYLDVKNQKTGHKESILIEYDSDIIKFEDIINIFFDTIDPFDDSGQFIDRGMSYTTAVFTSDEAERDYLKSFISDIEYRFNKKVYVPILDNTVFYKAEEYHQDYAIKNPKEMEEELIASGRKNRNQ